MTELSVEENLELKELLQKEIAQSGPISFARFMEQCLYHPQHGYYSCERTRIGKQGDFFTSSSVHHLFGGLIARQVVQVWQLLENGPMTVVEQGAGEGYLCLDLLNALEFECPELYAQVEYKIIEISADHRRRQGEKLKKHIAAGRVSWCSLEDLRPFRGCFLSNELVDAFPVHLLEKQQGVLREIFVGCSAGQFVEQPGPLSDERLQDYFEISEQPLIEGNRAEVCLAAMDWMTRVAQCLEKGAVLTIDYGYPAKELLAPWRRSGTLMCYQRHQSHDNPYQSVGNQDITSHVNFTLLENVGRQQGLDRLYFGEQYRFLMGLGFLEELMRLQAQESDPVRAQGLRMTLKNLIMPEEGMGETFKVLLQGKGLGSPELLCARAIRDISLPPGG